MQVTKAKISSKNQVVVPKRVRQTLGLEAGDSVLLVVKDGTAFLIREPDSYIDALCGSMEGFYEEGYLRKERESWRDHPE